MPSNTVREGGFALRTAITDHCTTMADIDLLVDAVLEHADAPS